MHNICGKGAHDDEPLADKCQDAGAKVSDPMILGPETWDRFNATPEDILWYYESILEIAKERSENEFLVTNLEAAVQDMELNAM